MSCADAGSAGEVDRLASTAKETRRMCLKAITGDVTEWPDAWVCLRLLVFVRDRRDAAWPEDLDAWLKLINPIPPAA
eukprot:5990805-Amphidinium_carterae.1